MTDLLQLVVYGIVTGSILALGAIGVSLVFSILRFAHFAHGDLMTIGAYGGLIGVALAGVSPIVALPIAIALAVAVALAAEFILYRPLRSSHPIILLISSFGLALILRSAVQLVAGPSPMVYRSGIQMPMRFGDIIIRPDHFWIIGGTLVIILALHLFLSRSKFGKAMRAMSDNMDLARISGIPAYKMILLTWVIAASLAAVAGVFLGMDTRLHPVMGWRLLLPVFAAAILGGIGRPYGAIAGGFIIGISMEVSTMFIDPGYKHAVAFALLVLMLIVRPTGIFKGKSL
ncbi:branched-chain amino acid ABC transporter permease [Amorphus orientalis]|uniref:Branched-chain amino acid transport system permease protein/neutral amino acid transport system permease protein n=1 Tax=Amorphus orientalis TaxID=649198 RepID=A0AAE3VSE7_9HYPH|nr:branched-chain amino acid ABC transporter permease [Amorphus orientalis]MDQ0316960.1 branched-chain amino acid transport system permease protein/neutral amino acid transport system permease protein [Amorphus orientalis]